MAEEKKEFIQRRLNTYSSEEASKLIETLYGSQVNRISSGEMYSQTEIKKEMKNLA